MSFIFLLTGLLAEFAAVWFGVDRMFGDDAATRFAVLFIIFMTGCGLSFSVFNFL